LKVNALDKGLCLLQPTKTTAPEFLQSIRQLSPDISVIAAYGKILKEETLSLPRLGSICIHPSLLPRYRGASPVQRSILAGDTETGITIFQMDEGMDSGDILIQKEIPIYKGERAGELTERLGHLSSDVLHELLQLMEAGRVHPKSQDESGVTYAPKIEVEEAKIDWEKDPGQLELESRAFDPWPGPFTFIGGERLRLFGINAIPAFHGPEGKPGEVVGIEIDGPVVRAGDGHVKVTEFQSPGKKRMDAASWLRGKRLKIGEGFGS
jgi:methionyl-tRNA formyltransferase